SPSTSAKRSWTSLSSSTRQAVSASSSCDAAGKAKASEANATIASRRGSMRKDPFWKGGDPSTGSGPGSGTGGAGVTMVGMFAGSVEGMGQVSASAPVGGAYRLIADVGALAEGVKEGDSVAIDGTCLTAVAVRPPRLEFDVVRETVERTAFSTVRVG